MWWKDGFPGIIDTAPWERCIQTGHYGLVFDSTNLTLPHFGAGPDIEKLPPAMLGLSLVVDGKTYRSNEGGKWSRHKGPRLIESGKFFQRIDVTDLVFKADDGSILNAESRIETAAWADRLAFILAVKPGVLPIVVSEESFGRVRGGYGLTGSNHFEISKAPNLDTENFTLECWTFVPTDYQATDISPWLICKNRNEFGNGNYGIVLKNGAVPQIRLNLGGGKENAHTLDVEQKFALHLNQWNHIALSYDGDTLRFYANGRMAGELKIGKKRQPVPGAIAIGRREDNNGDGYYFRGIIDEVRLYDRALTLPEYRQHHAKPEQPRPALKPIAEWTFHENAMPSMTRQSEVWKHAAMEVSLFANGKTLHSNWELPKEDSWSGADWKKTALAIDPVVFSKTSSESKVDVQAHELATNEVRPVEFNPSLGWHKINLDGIQPINPAGVEAPSNDAIERIQLTLKNPTDQEQTARLMFEKTARGFRQRIGSAITGISAVLRDVDGNPTGIPVQLSKNWHNDAEAGVYSGQWFHGISRLQLPKNSTTELELTIAYGHWGGVPAASHAQLSLIGWGGNSLWEQSSLGSWGESICYDPNQAQANSTITDVRPLMVNAANQGANWSWTSNVGGGDFFRLFDSNHTRIPHTAMRTNHHRYGPCLTEVTYSGRIGSEDTGLKHSATVSLGRTDDLVRGTYRIRVDVTKPVDFSRFVIFQIGSDTYSSTGENKMAIGNIKGLSTEWKTQWGGNVYRTEPFECVSRVPWASLHEAVPREGQIKGAWANRGMVIREWKAKLGGEIAKPWLAERGLDLPGTNTASTMDLIPPPGVSRLEPGDFIEATIEHIIVPQSAAEYYGPNKSLRPALTEHGNSWQMIHREASQNDRQLDIKVGTLERKFPDIRITTEADKAEFTLTGGIGFVPLTFTGLYSHSGFTLKIDGKPFDQSVHGNDFWQTEFDPELKTWSQTFNIPVTNDKDHTIQFGPK